MTATKSKLDAASVGKRFWPCLCLCS